MKMVTALLKASFLVVLSLLIFSTTSQAQSKTAQLTTVKAEAQTYEQAQAELVMWQKAVGNLPTQGSQFSPEQYVLVEQYIQQNLKATEAKVAALKPKSVNE